MGHVYKITNTVNGKCYIGMTTGVVDRRRRHFRALLNGQHHSRKFQHAYNKYGRDAFEFEVIGEYPDDELPTWEVYWIQKYRSVTHGYNMVEGGPESTAIPCVWNGKYYPSRVAMAADLGLSQFGANYRINRGYTCDSDIEAAKANNTHGRKAVLWNGVEYRSVSEAAKANGIYIATMSQRLSKGYTCDEDMIGPKFNNGLARPCIWNGIEYPSMADAAKANNVGAHAMWYRIEQGYTCDADVGLPPRHAMSVTWNDVRYDTLAMCARANGVSRHTMKFRIEQGYTCDADMQRQRKKLRPTPLQGRLFPD